MIINRKICPPGLNNNPNQKLAAINYITIHCTGNYNPSATAMNHALYLYGGSGGTQTSWHYTVDKDEIWQSFEDNQRCWHSGDGTNGPGNSTSIAIEICVNDKTGFKAACGAAARLTAELMKKYSLTIDRVSQHKKWYNKNCPAELISGEWGVTWNEFIAMCTQYLDASQVCIISAATATLIQMQTWARTKGATDTFVSLAALYCGCAPARGNVNPVPAYCQAALETGYGKFSGVVPESYCNPCGLKTKNGSSDTDPAEHQRFSGWEEGIKAHLDHLALYAGAAGYPRADSPDPRHFTWLFGTGKTVEAMAKSWCPGNPAYAGNILTMMNEIEKTTVQESDDDDVITAIGKLVQHGVISSPDYWLINYNKLRYLDKLLINMAAKLP